jgi:Sulfotransferase domain
MSTVWLASYPKSGNTWVRFMLYSAIYGAPKRSEDVPLKIPDIHRPMPFEKPESGSIYVKSHFELTDKHPQLADTTKAIHIIRNPRDVMLSAIHYRILTDEKPKDFPKEQFVKSYLKSGGDRHWQKIGFGTWASHARSWRNTDRFPVLNLRYEDLKADPHIQLARMLEFLGIACSESKINEAVIASSFDSMRALEIREKKSSKPNDLSKHLFVGTQDATRKGIFFMNKGKSNQSLDALMPGLDARFNERFKDELLEFGY